MSLVKPIYHACLSTMLSVNYCSEPAAEVPGELVGTRAAGRYPQVLIDRFEVRLRIYISYRFPGDADTADLGPHFETQGSTRVLCVSCLEPIAYVHS